MINKVLFATDYSEASLNALETAICIAVKNKAMLQLLHVMEPDHDGLSDEHVREQSWQVTEAMAGNIDVINKQFFIGPFCQQIIHHSQVPVLYLR
jgi:nucleotide-binding universal stress UspA family protein